MEMIIADLMHIFTPAGGMALLNIILIDLVMSGDNAILIGMATKNLKGVQRKKAIFWGVAGATILRILFSVMVVWLLKIPGLQFFGAILLLYVVWKFYREIRSSENQEHSGNTTDNLLKAIKTIIIADVAMSLDNVLAVAGASHGNFTYLIIGLIISIILMVVASGAIANLLDKYPSIQWAGLFIIFFTAIEMLETGMLSSPINTETLISGHLFTLLLFVVVAVFAILQTTYLDAKHDIFLEWAKKNGKFLMIGFFLLLILIATSGSTIQAFLQSHHGYYYGIIIVSVLGIMEILRLKK